MIRVQTMPALSITFFQRFEQDILAGRKTITIRDESERHFSPGDRVEVRTLEEDRTFCRVQILSVQPIKVNQLDESHAEQENMTLTELTSLIEQIYPGIESLYVIEFFRIAD